MELPIRKKKSTIFRLTLKEIAKIMEILGKEGLTSLEFDLTVGPELYVRTRIERGGNRGRAYYFVRSGDTAERGEGACPDEAFAKILKELAEAAGAGEPAATSHRLAVNDGGQTSALTAGQLTAVAESLACHVDELSLLDNFKPYIR